jgi:hypothetical protein
MLFADEPVKLSAPEPPMIPSMSRKVSLPPSTVPPPVTDRTRPVVFSE